MVFAAPKNALVSIVILSMDAMKETVKISANFGPLQSQSFFISTRYIKVNSAFLFFLCCIQTTCCKICPSVHECAVRKENSFWFFTIYWTNFVQFHLHFRNKDTRTFKTDDFFCTRWSEIFQAFSVFFSLADYNHIVWDIYISSVSVVDCTRNTQIYPTIDLICRISKMFLMIISNQIWQETKVTLNYSGIIFIYGGQCLWSAEIFLVRWNVILLLV